MVPEIQVNHFFDCRQKKLLIFRHYPQNAAGVFVGFAGSAEKNLFFPFPVDIPEGR